LSPPKKILKTSKKNKNIEDPQRNRIVEELVNQTNEQTVLQLLFVVGRELTFVRKKLSC